MASEDASARRYAQAALDLATQQSALDTWAADLDGIGQVWQDQRLRRFLDDIKLSKQERMARAREILADRVSPLALNLVLLMIFRGRSHLLPRVVTQFAALRKRQERVMDADVTSAIPLTEIQMADLARQLSQQSGQEVTISNTIDPSILGGLIIRQGDRLIDASVIGKLHRLEQQIGGSPGAQRGRIV